MKTILFSAALSLAAILPAAAQMAPPPGPPMGPMSGMMMSGPMPGGQSCVSGGQFVPCPPAGGMQPGMGGMQPGMEGGMDQPRRRMTKREMRRQRVMEEQGSM